MLIRLKDNLYAESGDPDFAPGKIVEAEKSSDSMTGHFPVHVNGAALRPEEYEVVEPLTEDRVREIVREELDKDDLDNPPRALVTFVLPDDLVKIMERSGSDYLARLMHAWARGLEEDGRAYTPQIIRAIADELD